jgi:polyisoprenoid-binding protein YceI
MRRAFIALSLTLAAAPALVVAQMPGKADAKLIAAGTYEVDPAHTQVTWQVNHMGFSMLQGQFGASGGSITVDPGKPAASKVEVTFAMDKLSVTSEQFANHLKGKDFFDVATFPTAKFVSTSVKPGANNTATITGNLTIKDITKPVTLQARLIGAGANPMNKQMNFGFLATGKVKRSDFGAGMAAPVVSDEVDLVINAAFVKKS